MLIKSLVAPNPQQQAMAKAWLELSTARMHLPEAEWQAWRRQPEVAAMETAYRQTAGVNPMGRMPGVVGADVT